MRGIVLRIYRPGKRAGDGWARGPESLKSQGAERTKSRRQKAERQKAEIQKAEGPDGSDRSDGSDGSDGLKGLKLFLRFKGHVNR